MAHDNHSADAHAGADADNGTTATRADDAKVAGRGFLFIAFAKVYFIAAGALVTLGLPRMLGKASLFGDFNVVNRLISLINMVMIAGTIQAVSKVASERDGVAGAVRRQALLVQLTLGLPVAAALFLFADPIAAHLFQDARLAQYLRVASLIPLFYCFYAVFVGLCNGTKNFLKQASLDVSFSTFKTAAIVGLVLAGFGVMGAFAGFAGAALAVLVLSIWVTRKLGGGTRAEVPFKRLLLFMLPVMVYTLLVNVLLQADSLMLKAMKFEPLMEHFGSGLGRVRLAFLLSPLGASAPAGADATSVLTAFATQGTSTLVGVFGAVKYIAVLPYQVVIAITFVVFPMISRAAFDEDRERTRGYITQSFRYALLLLALTIVCVAAAGDDIIRVLFGADYLAGARAMTMLLGAIVGFTLYYLGNAIITGAGRPVMAALLGLPAVVLNVGLLWFLLDTSGDWQEALESAALAGLLSMLIGFLPVAGYIWKKYGALAPLSTLIRVLVLGTAIGWAARFVPLSGFFGMVAKAGGAGLLLIVGLVLTREFGAADMEKLRSVLGKRSGK